MRTRPWPVLVAALGIATSGCSLVAVRRPPPVTAEKAPECTQSRLAPGLDTAGAITSALVGVTLWGLCEYTTAISSWGSEPSHPNCGAVLWGGALSAAAYTGSAVYGFRATGECRRRTEEWRASPADHARPGG
jgi:hypothetical protein